MEEPEVTPILEKATRIRADLHSALIEAEDAIAAAAPGRFLEWVAGVQKSLVHLHDAFSDHIMYAEGPDGLYVEVLDREPRLRATVARIRAEHPTISGSIHIERDRLKAVLEGLEIPADDIRRDVTKILARITRHRQQGADLIYEAYFVDLGGMD
jgi:hypothetical protein